MQPLFSYSDIVYEEVAYARDDAAHAEKIFASIGADIQEALTKGQSKKARISDAGRCSLEQWAKVNDELTLKDNPLGIFTRMQPGTLMGALVSAYFKAGMDRRGVPCVLEKPVNYYGMSGHIDAYLPTYHHLYENKMTNSLKGDGPQRYHYLQAGMYCNACEEETGEKHTASIVMLALPKRPATMILKEYQIDDELFWESATLEAERIVRASGADAPPLADVNEKEKWRCSLSCGYGLCPRNTNPMKDVRPHVNALL